MYQEVGLEGHHPKGPNIDCLGELLLLIEQQLGCPVYDSTCNLIGGLLHGGCAEISNLEDAYLTHYK